MKNFALIIMLVGAVMLAGCSGGSLGNGLGFAQDEYSILLSTTQGPRHAEMAQYYKDQTEKHTDWQGLYIVHKENQSDLYWGKYPNHESAQKDLSIARNLMNNGRRIYPFASVVPIAGKNLGPAEYDLANAQGHWTVLVGLFIDDQKNRVVGRKRMQAAVEYCKWLRQQGYEAYYYHRSARSQVTVGTFPENAVVMEKHKNVYVPKIESSAMKKILLTEDPPLKFLAVNGRQEIVTRYAPNGQKKKKISQSRPIPIPKNFKLAN